MCVCELTSKIIRNRVISSINSLLAQLFRLALIFSLSLTPQHSPRVQFTAFVCSACAFAFFPSLHSQHDFYFSILSTYFSLSLSCCSPPKKLQLPLALPPLRIHNKNNENQVGKWKKRRKRTEKRKKKKLREWKIFLLFFHIYYISSLAELSRALSISSFFLYSFRSFWMV